MDEWTNSAAETGAAAPKPETGGGQRPDGSKSTLRAVFSRFSLVYLLTVLVMTVLSFIPDLPDSNWFLALMNTFLEDIWYYGPFFLFFALLLRPYPMARQADLPGTCSRPKVLQMVTVFLFAAGTSYFFGLLPKLLVSFFGGGSSGSSEAAAYLLVNLVDTAIIVPILEELIFRRTLQDRLMFLGSGTALLLTSLFFAVAHMNPARLLYTFCIGLILGTVHMRTGKMRWNIALHMCLNAMNVLIGYGGTIAGVLWIFGTIIFAVIYVIVRRPWRGIPDRSSAIPGREKFAACMTSVPFWITILVLIVLAILKQLL